MVIYLAGVKRFVLSLRCLSGFASSKGVAGSCPGAYREAAIRIGNAESASNSLITASLVTLHRLTLIHKNLAPTRPISQYQTSNLIGTKGVKGAVDSTDDYFIARDDRSRNEAV